MKRQVQKINVNECKFGGGNYLYFTFVDYMIINK